MNALVTGAAGFLGRHIVEHLHANGIPVRAFCRASSTVGSASANGHALSNSSEDRVDIVHGDIRDSASLDAALQGGIDTVFHVAGRAGLWGSWKSYHTVNVWGTNNVIEACRRHGVKRLVYTSSPSVVFTTVDQCGADESLPYPRRWLTNYPRSKAIAEQAVLSANGKNLLTCALRPHLIWGPGDRHLLPRLIGRARSGRLRRVGDGSNLVDTTFVDNAATAHLQAALALCSGSPACGRPYFISQDEPLNCWQWIDQLLALHGLPAPHCSISMERARKLGAAFEATYRLLRIQAEPPMTRFLAVQLGRSHWFDISAARRDLGYRPVVSTSEGMRRLQKWVESHQLLSANSSS